MQHRLILSLFCAAAAAPIGYLPKREKPPSPPPSAPQAAAAPPPLPPPPAADEGDSIPCPTVCAIGTLHRLRGTTPCPAGCDAAAVPSLLHSEGLLATPPSLSSSGGYGGRLRLEASGILGASGERPLQVGVHMLFSALAPRGMEGG